jgi:hypothetical protein
VKRAFAGLAMLAVAGAIAACDYCETAIEKSTFELRDDELDERCEDVCAKAIAAGYDFEGCERSAPGVSPPTITCTFSLEACGGTQLL